MTRGQQRALFLLVVVTVSGLMLIYPPLRLMHLVMPDLPQGFWLAALLFALPFLARTLQERVHRVWTRAVSAVAMTWLGICFMAFCLLIPTELILLSGLVDPRQAGYALIIGLVVLTAYGSYNAQRVRVERVSVNGLPAVRGLRLAQISDVHVGSRQPGILRRIVDHTNRLKPDMVVITGDLIDMRGITRDDLAPLQTLCAPVWFCIGNHERYVDLEDICARLTALGVQVLRNSAACHRGLQIIGIDDAEARDQVARHLPSIQPETDHYRILLYHRPDGAEDAAGWGAHLMLTGHTHRGQIVPFNLLVSRVFPRLYRSYQVDGMTLYVSPGTGTWGPVLRLGSKCEITLFELV